MKTNEYLNSNKMSMRLVKLGFSLTFMALAAHAGITLAQSANGGEDPPRLYTEDQAAAGAELYKKECALCHGGGLEGRVGPTLRGDGFASEKNGFTMGQMFSYVANQMPGGDPGSLKDGEYEAIWAFMLKKNGYPAGDAPVHYKTMIKSDIPLISHLAEDEDLTHTEFEHLGSF